ncbi:hypothetical protein AB0B63_23305 [Micromonospora sp. NPDC049081]|uniref:hypothetical protein n=1 Tax=Micromonospora sp. NPDC049081 TaxID=3155150 RepID=UPI0034025979
MTTSAPISPGEFKSWLTVLRDLPGDRFDLVLKIVEEQLARNHELLMAREETRRQEVAAELSAEAARRSDRLLLWGLVAGLVIVLGMTAASIVVGLQGHVWLSATLSGPSVIALASLFVLRKAVRVPRSPGLPVETTVNAPAA